MIPDISSAGHRFCTPKFGLLHWRAAKKFITILRQAADAMIKFHDTHRSTLFLLKRRVN